jgi:hypothetical protein
MKERYLNIDIAVYLRKIIEYCLETVEQMLSNIRLSVVA